jgi:hypothetical protein
MSGAALAKEHAARYTAGTNNGAISEPITIFISALPSGFFLNIEMFYLGARRPAIAEAVARQCRVVLWLFSCCNASTDAISLSNLLDGQGLKAILET